jgi:hypothetical protein
VSSFTISDGIFGTCFFFGTGFHGLIIFVALFIYLFIRHKTNQIYKIENNKILINNTNMNNKLLINLPASKNKEANSYYLENDFLE